ncbi:MAG: 50S ribosomal protein L30 [Alphaproteobacteria bacterium]|nr:50S ribosomal protein L30 [Alphaproteobacteria bacterium]
MAQGKQLKITQVRSSINAKVDQQANLVGLGIRHRMHTVTREDTPAVRGMVRKVRHLVTVEELNG